MGALLNTRYRRGAEWRLPRSGMMDRLEMLTAFAAAVDEGSLAAAGRKLGRSPAAMTRAIAALERSVGEPL